MINQISKISKIILAFLFYSNLAFANHPESFFNCTIGDNWSLFPTTLSINMSQNSTASFSMQSILLGNCNIAQISFTGCEWCAFAENNYLQMHGSNHATTVLITVPSLPTNWTNQTYNYTIFTTATTNITSNVFDNSTNRTIAVPNNTILAKNTTLFIFVAFNETNYTFPNPTKPNVTAFIENLTTLVAGLDKEHQLQVALLLDSIFKGYNWSFIIKQPELRTVEIPVIANIPVNAKEFLEWQRQCNPIVIQEANSKYNECNQKYNQSLEVIKAKDSALQLALEDKRVCASELTYCYTGTNVTRDNLVTQATVAGERAVNLGMASLLISVIIIFAIIWSVKYNIKFPFKMPFIKTKTYEVSTSTDPPGMPKTSGKDSPKNFKSSGEENMFGDIRRGRKDGS